MENTLEGFNQAVVTVQHSENVSLSLEGHLDKNTNTSQCPDTQTENSIDPPEPILSKEPRLNEMTPKEQKSMTPPALLIDHQRDSDMNVMFVDEA